MKMIPVNPELIKYLIKSIDGMANVMFVGKPAARAAVQAETDALQLMIEEGRGPSAEEWAAHDASMATLKSRLHD
jgi:hypothetical protein